MGQSILQGNGCGANKEFLFVGGNPVFAACAYIAYNGKNFNQESNGLYGREYAPLEWCKVKGDTSRGEYGQVITVTITKACKVSVYSMRPLNNSTVNSKVEIVENTEVQVGKTYSIRGNDYNQGLGIVVIKED